MAAAQYPREEYERRLLDRRNVAAQVARLDERLSLARGVAFLAAVGCWGAAVFLHEGFWWGALLAGAVFVALVIRHGRVAALLNRSKRAVRFYETALARLDDRWMGTGPTGERYLDGEHLYAEDLDLFGPGSLFQLLCRARTRPGEDRLAEWLLQPATPAVLPARQEAIASLAGHLDLREKLGLLEADVHEDLDQNRLREWAAGVPRPFSPAVRFAAVLLALFALASLALWLFFEQRATWPIAALALQSAFLLAHRKAIREVAAGSEKAASGLDVLAQVLRLLEGERFEHSALQSMQARLETRGHAPSRAVRRLNGLVGWLNNCLRNQFFALFGFLLLLPVHLVHAVERWREDVGSRIPDWLDAVAEFEALNSLAGYACENPEAVRADLVEDGPCFEAQALGHPLLPRGHCVRNDLQLGPECRLMLISGSNMSGKSTLLRAVGVNAVLAQAGAPVRAKRLALSPLQVASSMHVQDSLQDGRSLFAAAVRRIKAIVDAAEQSPLTLLFLLDEILQGTNSRDRRQGAEGVLRTLVARGGIGLITTHDLALTEVVASFDGRAVNAHFQDDIVEGRMNFDYRLRPGVVEQSNALQLMRSMGLDV